jgi:transposase
MEQYVALDVSLREISVCVMDGNGVVLFEGKTSAEPVSLAALLRAKAPQVVRIGLEAGATSPWLFHALTAAGLPVVCMDEVTPAGSPTWCGYREVHAKSITSHERRTILGARYPRKSSS